MEQDAQNNRDSETQSAPAGPLLDTPFVGTLQPPDDAVARQGSLLDDPSPASDVTDEILPEPSKGLSRRRLIGLSVLLVGCAAAILLGLRIEADKSKFQNASVISPSAQLKEQQLPLTSLSSRLAVTAATVNGAITVNGSLVLTPTVQPSSPLPGEVYYNQVQNKILYYNGSSFVPLQGSVTNNYTTNNSTTTNNNTVSNTYSSNTYVTNNNGTALTGTPGTLAVFDTTGGALADSLMAQNGTDLVTSATDIIGSDASGLNITTAGSTTGPSGSVSFDVGAGVVNGTVVENYTFESGIDGFNGSPYGSAISQSNVMAHTGSYSLAVSLTTGNWASTSIGGLTVVPGHEYRMTAWVRAGTAPAPVYMGAYFRTLNVDSPSVNTTDSTGAWTEMTNTFINPVGNTSMDLDFVYEKNANETHYIDDVTLTDLNTFTGLGVNIGTTNAQDVNIGNSNQAGDTTITGGATGVKVEDSTGAIDVSGAGVAIDSSANATLTTDSAVGATGTITIESGASSTTASGDVTIDTGSGYVSGVVVGDITFEDDTNDNVDGWYNATTAPTNIVAHSGTYSLAATLAGGSWGISANQNFAGTPVTAGHHIFFSLWVRAATTPRTIDGQIIWGGGGAVTITPVTDSTTGWTNMTMSATVPAGVTELYFDLESTAGAAGEVHYFDDVTVTDLSSSSSTSSLDLGSTNAQIVNVGNMNELGATTIDGGSGITLNSGSGPLTVNAGSISIEGTAASSVGTTAGSLTLSAGGGSGGGVDVRPESDTTTAFQVQSAEGGSLFDVDTTDMAITISGSVTVNSTLTINGHIIVGGSTPSIVVGSAPCTGLSVGIAGNDTAGTITVTTSSSGCTGGGALATVTFAAPFGTAPTVELTPGSPVSQTLGAYVDDSTITGNSFVLGTNATPAASQTFKWNYIAVQ